MRLSGTLLLVLLASAARADDAQAPAPDSIASAKKDLAAIKSPQVPTDSAAVLPTVDMKDIGPVPDATRSDAPALLDLERDPALDPAKKKTGTGNWLVDAMDRNTANQASKSKEKDDILRGNPDLIRADEKGVRLDKDPFSIDDAHDREKPKEPAEAVYNPLDAFMSGWVSTRDRDLLLTSSKGDSLAGSDLGKVHADALPGLDLGQAGPADEIVLLGVDSAAFSPYKGANPYLDSVEALPVPAMKVFAAPDGSAFNPSGFTDLPQGMASSGVDARPIDTSRNFVPDFAQPDDDDKYFKQMKKF